MSDPALPQDTGQAVGPRIEFGVAEHLVFERQRDRVRTRLDLLLEQLVNQRVPRVRAGRRR